MNTLLPSFKSMTKVPVPAFLLAAMGAFPFTTLAGMIVTGFTVPGIDSSFALLVYGAVVLCVMGGVHWGLAMVAPADTTSRWGSGREWRAYGMSLVPPFFAWVALLVPVKLGAWLMAAAFVGLLVYDLWCVQRGEAPAWFTSLRWPLVVMAAGSLIVGIALARV
jgi:hypothetical protein